MWLVASLYKLYDDFHQETGRLAELAVGAGEGVEEVDGGGEGGRGESGREPKNARKDSLDYLHHSHGFLAQQTSENGLVNECLVGSN
jgi:hypothetical protein